MRIIAGVFALAFAAFVVGAASSAARPRPHLTLVSASPARLTPVLSDADPRNLDLTQLVPRAGRINHVWFIPAGRGHAQIAVSWQQGALRCAPNPRESGCEDSRLYYLALWNPQPTSIGWQKKWVPHMLVRRSGFPIAEGSESAIRLADVTGDGHDDLLITIDCADCGHGTAAVSVVATFGRRVRRIYGQGRLRQDKEPGAPVHGESIADTFWGAKGGMLWFDYPHISWQTGKRDLVFLKWQRGHGWTPVSSRGPLTEAQIERAVGGRPWTR